MISVHSVQLRSSPFGSLPFSQAGLRGLASFKQQIKAVALLSKVLQLRLFCSHIAFVATTAVRRHRPSVFLLFWNKKHTNTSFFRFGT